jgi:hypothetical protein
VLNLSNPGAFSYTPYTFDVTAPTGNNTLTFTFRQDPSYFLLDNVSVTDAPEPMSLALMGAGLGFVRHRRHG